MEQENISFLMVMNREELFRMIILINVGCIGKKILTLSMRENLRAANVIETDFKSTMSLETLLNMTENGRTE